MGPWFIPDVGGVGFDGGDGLPAAEPYGPIGCGPINSVTGFCGLLVGSGVGRGVDGRNVGLGVGNEVGFRDGVFVMGEELTGAWLVGSDVIGSLVVG